MEEKEYEITIREILQRKVRQRASSEEEAQEVPPMLEQNR